MNREIIFDNIEEIFEICNKRNKGFNETELDVKETITDYIVNKLTLNDVGSNVMAFKGEDTPHFYDWLKDNKVDFYLEKLLYKGDWYYIGELYYKYKILYKIPL